MTSALSTWDELGRLDGRVLAILNSPSDDERAVAALFDELQCRIPDAAGLHVVAPKQWRHWLAARGVADDRVLLSVDGSGADLELNHFLEDPSALLWIVDRRFDHVVGSAAYAVYNDEVKDIFERRLALLLGPGRFLAHTLPNRYVFVFDLPALLVRFGRRQTLDQYGAKCRALVDELYREWTGLGRPATSDDPAFSDVVATLARHLGAELLTFDEASPIPLKHPDLAALCADVMLYFRSVLREHDQRLAERVDAVRFLSELHAERVSAVNLRDAIIDTLREERETLVQRWRRKLRASL